MPLSRNLAILLLRILRVSCKHHDGAEEQSDIKMTVKRWPLTADMHQKGAAFYHIMDYGVY